MHSLQGSSQSFGRASGLGAMAEEVALAVTVAHAQSSILRTFPKILDANPKNLGDGGVLNPFCYKGFKAAIGDTN